MFPSLLGPPKLRLTESLFIESEAEDSSSLLLEFAEAAGAPLTLFGGGGGACDGRLGNGPFAETLGVFELGDNGGLITP
jgi:hypothetical protein